MSYSTTIYREIDGEEREIEIEVEYSYYRGCRGARDSLGGKRGAGPPLEPDEPESVEIESVVDLQGRAWELTDDETRTIEEKILENMEPDYD